MRLQFEKEIDNDGRPLAITSSLITYFNVRSQFENDSKLLLANVKRLQFEKEINNDVSLSDHNLKMIPNYCWQM